MGTPLSLAAFKRNYYFVLKLILRGANPDWAFTYKSGLHTVRDLSWSDPKLKIILNEAEKWRTPKNTPVTHNRLPRIKSIATDKRPSALVLVADDKDEDQLPLRTINESTSFHSHDQDESEDDDADKDKFLAALVRERKPSKNAELLSGDNLPTLSRAVTRQVQDAKETVADRYGNDFMRRQTIINLGRQKYETQKRQRKESMALLVTEPICEEKEFSELDTMSMSMTKTGTMTPLWSARTAMSSSTTSQGTGSMRSYTLSTATTFGNTMSTAGTGASSRTFNLFDVDEGDTLKKRIEVEQAESSGNTKKEARKYMANMKRKPAMTISGVFAEHGVKAPFMFTAQADSDSDSDSMAMVTEYQHKPLKMEGDESPHSDSVELSKKRRASDPLGQLRREFADALKLMERDDNEDETYEEHKQRMDREKQKEDTLKLREKVPRLNMSASISLGNKPQKVERKKRQSVAAKSMGRLMSRPGARLSDLWCE